MAVLDDIIDGSDLIQSDTVITKIRIAIVTGVTGTAAEREYDALTTGGVPALGDALGASVPLSNCKVVRRSAGPVAGQPKTIHIRLEYSTETTAITDPSDALVPTYRSGSVVEAFQTNRDIDGVPFSLTHNGKTKGAEATVFRPSQTETMTRIENGIDPSALQDAYVGKVNSTGWIYKTKQWVQADPGSGLYAVVTVTGDTKQWLCTGIECESTDGGSNWIVSYSFARRREGWNPQILFRDADGEPADGLVDGTGAKRPDSYLTADFNELALLGPSTAAS